jgi:phosphoglycerate kinase
MRHGKVEDDTRITRLVPTLKYLAESQAKVVVISHFDRPKGEFVLEMSLAPLVDSLSAALGGKEVHFAVDCIGNAAKEAVQARGFGDIIMLENLRFHAGEEKNDHAFSKKLASLGDIYINDAFSCSHRSHASIVGLAALLPNAAGLLLEDEIGNLERILSVPKQPMAAIVGGSKVSTKLELLHSLVTRVKMLVIGGAMANTFLKSTGVSIGRSLYEPELVTTAQSIMEKAARLGCEIILPQDVIVAEGIKERVQCQVLPTGKVPEDMMILDIGPKTVSYISSKLEEAKTLIWNGPLGAFEHKPFDIGTASVARRVAQLTTSGQLESIAGGGDIVSALGGAGLTDSFTYISTAGGAFLEWLEGKDLPGIAVLRADNQKLAAGKVAS